MLRLSHRQRSRLTARVAVQSHLLTGEIQRYLHSTAHFWLRWFLIFFSLPCWQCISVSSNSETKCNPGPCDCFNHMSYYLKPFTVACAVLVKLLEKERRKMGSIQKSRTILRRFLCPLRFMHEPKTRLQAETQIPERSDGGVLEFVTMMMDRP